jgi:hypothetical protein
MRRGAARFVARLRFWREFQQPLFPDDPYIAANRRVTITLMREEPPIPPNFKP